MVAIIQTRVLSNTSRNIHSETVNWNVSPITHTKIAAVLNFLCLVREKSEILLLHFSILRRKFQLKCLVLFIRIVTGDNTVPICGFASLQCLTNSQQSIVAEKLKNVTSGGVDSCSCLPSCTQITYNLEISQADLHYSKMMAAFDGAKDINDK